VRLASDAAGEFYDQTIAAGDAGRWLTELDLQRVYRASVVAVDSAGRPGRSSDPVVVRPCAVTPLANADQWPVFALPGVGYQAAVPLAAGDVPTLIDTPSGGSLSGQGVFTWQVPADAAGWYPVTIYVTHADGTRSVYRHQLLADTAAPQPGASPLLIQSSERRTLMLVAPDAVDASGVVAYQFEEDGQAVADWQPWPQASVSVNPNTVHTFRYRVRDASPGANESDWSASVTACSSADPPAALSVHAVGPDTVVVDGLGADANYFGTQCALLDVARNVYFDAAGGAGPSPVWRTEDEWSGVRLSGLEPGAEYTLAAVARDGAQRVTSPGPSVTVRMPRETHGPRITCLQGPGPDGVMDFTFSEPVVLSKKDLSLTTAGGAPLDMTAISFVHEPGTEHMRLETHQALARGDFVLKLMASSVEDVSGNPLDQDGNGAAGRPGDDFLFSFTTPIRCLDVDDDGKAQGLTDGLLILRRMFAFQGDPLVQGAVSAGSRRTQAGAIAPFLDGLLATALDADGNGKAEPLTDGLLILRDLFGFTGNSLTAGALASNATRRDPAAILQFLQPNLPTVARPSPPESSYDAALAAWQ
jgi:hypothetical protein